METVPTTGPAVFAIHDGTTYRNLQPIAAALPPSVDVEFLLLDDLFGEDGVPADELQPARRATSYVRDDLIVRLNRRSRPGNLALEGFQWLLEDVLSSRLAYRLDAYLADVDPSLFVCGHDRLPFVKHVIRRCAERGVPTAVVQHGIQRLAHSPSDSWLVNALRPSPEPRWSGLEAAKRRLLYPYGQFIFCNPHLERVFTIGDFFSDQIRAARAEVPGLGRGTVTSAGYPEYGLTELDAYEPTVESALYLSGWQYENGEWDDAVEEVIANRLRAIERENDIEVRVRPHPKDSAAKMERFYDGFERSQISDVAADIERHDFVCSVYSTALLYAAACGAVLGVIRIPRDRNRFGPFDHEHVLDVTADNHDVHGRAADRSMATQQDYLEQYCYIPAVHGDVSMAPAEYIASSLLELTDRRE